MIFLRPACYLRGKSPELVCISALVTVLDVFNSAIDFADSISLSQTNASTGRLAPEGTSLLNFLRHVCFNACDCVAVGAAHSLLFRALVYCGCPAAPVCLVCHWFVVCCGVVKLSRHVLFPLHHGRPCVVDRKYSGETQLVASSCICQGTCASMCRRRRSHTHWHRA